MKYGQQITKENPECGPWDQIPRITKTFSRICKKLAKVFYVQ